MPDLDHEAARNAAPREPAQRRNPQARRGHSSEVAPATARSALPILVLMLVWGCNWPVLKMGVTELAPLTFRSLTLPLAALGMLLVSRASGESIRVPRLYDPRPLAAHAAFPRSGRNSRLRTALRQSLWLRLAVLALFNIAGWNGFVLFGVQQLPAGRSAILAYTMPLWATLIATLVLHEPLSRRKLAGLLLGMSGMAILIGEEVSVIRTAPFGALMIIAAAFLWGLGTALLRKWQLPVAQNTLSGWMMLLGWIPLALAAPLFDPQPLGRELAQLSPRGWFALAYNVFLAGTLAHWAWFTLARTLPVAVSSLSSLPVPVVGVISGMVLLGERPGPQEWIALGFVVTALFIVLFEPPWKRVSAAPLAPDD